MTNERKFVRVEDAVEGSLVEADGGFTCIKKGTILKIVQDVDGDLCVPCDKGLHGLAGQVEKDYLIGFYPLTD